MPDREPCVIGAHGVGVGVKPSAKRWLLLLALAALVLCGCGTSSDPLGAVAGAARKTSALTWVRYQAALEHPHLFTSGVKVLGGRAAYDFRTGLGYEFMVLQGRGGSSETLWLDFTPTSFLLMPQPAPAGALPAGKPWISVPLSGGQAHGASAAQVQALTPELPLDELAWGAQSASDLGTRVVGQVPLDEYKVTIDLAKTLAAARRAGRAAVAAALESELRASGSGRVTMHVWIDGPGYVGRVDAPVPGSGLGTASLTFTSYSLRFTGTLPPSSQTVALASLSRAGPSLWSFVTGS